MELNKKVFTSLIVAIFLLAVLSASLVSAISCSITSPTDGSVDTDGDVTFKVTCTDFPRNITGDVCNLTFSGTNPGSSVYSGTPSNTTATNFICTKRLTNIPEQSYKWTMTLSNTTDTSASSESTVVVDITTSMGRATKIIAETPGAKSVGGALVSVPINGTLDNKTIWVFVIIITVVVIIAIKRRK